MNLSSSSSSEDDQDKDEREEDNDNGATDDGFAEWTEEQLSSVDEDDEDCDDSGQLDDEEAHEDESVHSEGSDIYNTDDEPGNSSTTTFNDSDARHHAATKKFHVLEAELHRQTTLLQKLKRWIYQLDCRRVSTDNVLDDDMEDDDFDNNKEEVDDDGDCDDNKYHVNLGNNDQDDEPDGNTSDGGASLRWQCVIHKAPKIEWIKHKGTWLRNLDEKMHMKHVKKMLTENPHYETKLLGKNGLYPKLQAIVNEVFEQRLETWTNIKLKSIKGKSPGVYAHKIKGQDKLRFGQSGVCPAPCDWYTIHQIGLGPASGCRVPALDVGPRNDRQMTAANHHLEEQFLL